MMNSSPRWRGMPAVGLNDRISRADLWLRERELEALPVVEQGQLVGCVERRRLEAYLCQKNGCEGGAGCRVSELMTAPIAELEINRPLADLLAAFLTHSLAAVVLCEQKNWLRVVHNEELEIWIRRAPEWSTKSIADGLRDPSWLAHSVK